MIEILFQEDGNEADLEVLRHDAHWVPNVDGTLDRGILDWDLIAEHVAKAPMQLPADFEVVLTVKDGDLEDELNQLIICREQAELFYQKVINYKGK